jgi:hypothetical protein
LQSIPELGKSHLPFESSHGNSESGIHLNLAVEHSDLVFGLKHKLFTSLKPNPILLQSDASFGKHKFKVAAVVLFVKSVSAPYKLLAAQSVEILHLLSAVFFSKPKDKQAAVLAAFDLQSLLPLSNSKSG